MLLSHRLEINSTIKYDSFQFDENYFSSDYSSDKIINIQWNNKDITKLINELKKYIANVSSKIGSYLAHIDSDTLEYVKDIYYDLALPFKLNKNEKIKSNMRLYNIIFDEILQERFDIKNLKFNCSKTTIESILRIDNGYVKILLRVKLKIKLKMNLKMNLRVKLKMNLKMNLKVSLKMNLKITLKLNLKLNLNLILKSLLEKINY